MLKNKTSIVRWGRLPLRPGCSASCTAPLVLAALWALVYEALDVLTYLRVPPVVVLHDDGRALPHAFITSPVST